MAVLFLRLNAFVAGIQKNGPREAAASPRGTLRSAFVLLTAAAVLAVGACGVRVPLMDGNQTGPAGKQTSAPVALPERTAEATSLPEPEPAEEPILEAEPAKPREEGTSEALEPLAELDAEIPAIFADEEPPASEEEIALLDELIGLSPPGAPRVLTHEEALLLTSSELPLVMNENVQRLVNYFTKTKRGSATIRNSTGHGAAYRQMIERILEEENVPAELYYLAMAESGFRPKARSHARATGMWQFMSSRGKQYGLRQDRYVDLRYDPETATRAAARHLKDLHIEFKDWYLAMAAYNSGPNRVKSAIRRTGSRDYWTLVRRRALPRETRNYVPIILAMVYVGENLDLFDLEPPDPAPPREYDTVRTETETSFALIADATGSSVEAIKDLNQALLRSATPPYGYDLRIPKGSAGQFEQEVALVPRDKRLNWRRYEVRQGETLAALAGRYKVSQSELALLNSLDSSLPLEGGTRLTVPTTTKLAIYRYYGQAGGLLEPGTGRYRIARGDTLGGIARRFRTSVSRLMDWNGLSSTRIRAGRYLIVQPEGMEGTTATASAGAAPTGIYKVRRGDTLGKIAMRHRTSVARLKAWNNMRGDTIRIGESLKVPGPAPTSAGIPSAPRAAPSDGHYLIRPGDSLSEISERFGVSMNSLRSWNNLRGSRITAGKYLRVRPPSASPSPRPAAAASPTRPTPAADRSGSVRYVVRSGDTLGDIAERYNVTAAKLRAWNGIRGSMIRPGQEIVVREQPAGQTATAAPPTRSAGGAGSGTYTVRSGDTLGGIAERYGVTAAKLRAWNGIRGSMIRPGQKLQVRAPSGGGATRQATARPAGGTYRVGRGDTLEAIARRHGTTIQNLKAWNNLRSDRIYPGQELAVRGGQSQNYRIRSGDTLEGIAQRFNVTVAELKRWNGLRSSRIQAGKTLVIQSSGS